MNRQEDEVIVLSVELVGEADRRVLLLNSQGELVRALAPAAARSRRRFGAALQPGARCRARWTVRAESAPAVLDEAQLLALPPTPDPLERYYTAAHMLESTAAFAREGAEDPRLFRLLAASLERLAAGDPAAPLARYFEAWTLRLAGLLPELDECAGCGSALKGRAVRIAGERGAFCASHAPAGSRALSAAAAAWLDQTRRRSPEDLPPLSPAADVELQRVLPALIGDFTERPLLAWDALRRLQSRGGAGETP